MAAWCWSLQEKIIIKIIALNVLQINIVVVFRASIKCTLNAHKTKEKTLIDSTATPDSLFPCLVIKCHPIKPSIAFPFHLPSNNNNNNCYYHSLSKVCNLYRSPSSQTNSSLTHHPNLPVFPPEPLNISSCSLAPLLYHRLLNTRSLCSRSVYSQWKWTWVH